MYFSQSVWRLSHQFQSEQLPWIGVLLGQGRQIGTLRDPVGLMRRVPELADLLRCRRLRDVSSDATNGGTRATLRDHTRLNYWLKNGGDAVIPVSKMDGCNNRPRAVGGRGLPAGRPDVARERWGDASCAGSVATPGHRIRGLLRRRGA